jgi:hypothetical protein
MHIDKHDKKIIYSCENILSKGPMKMIWFFFVPNHSLRWFVVVSLKDGFASMKIQLVIQGPPMEVCQVVQKCFILGTMDYKQGVFKHNEVELRCPKTLITLYSQ